MRLTLGGESETIAGPNALPLAVDWAARAGVVEHRDKSILIVPTSQVEDASGPPTTTTTTQQSTSPESWSSEDLWSSERFAGLPLGATHGRPCAVVTIGGLRAVANAISGGGLEVIRPAEDAGDPITIAWIATGPSAVTALASDQSGSLLGVAVGRTVGVWTLARDRNQAGVPGYDSDTVSDRATKPPDLLDADRDAKALAQLIASRQLEPPLAIGLFGAWGSGKSFVLTRIVDKLDELNKSSTAGYLSHLRVVPFNAWHYAETNLWASLVDAVLKEIGKEIQPEEAEEVKRAEASLEEAHTKLAEAQRQVDDSTKELKRKSRQLALRRRWLKVILGVVVTLGLALLLLKLLGSDVWSWAILALGGVGTALAAARGIQRTTEEVITAAQTGRDGWRQVASRLGSDEVTEAAKSLDARMVELEDARVSEADARAWAEHAKRLATATDLGAVLTRLSSESEYRDQLSIVTRTRDRFRTLDTAITKAREQRERTATGDEPPEQSTEQTRSVAAPTSARAAVADRRDETHLDPSRSAEPAETGKDGERGGEVLIDRVIVVIDDLDRCSPEKVVSVLEAVHLLFDFRMFVVILAVDTRWLKQSLLIQYRKLLGKTATASPADYLEKIIQIPLHLVPLDRALVASMLYGLTDARVARKETETPDPISPHDGDGSGPTEGLPGDDRSTLRGTAPRPRIVQANVQPLLITRDEVEAMCDVASLIGTTPRTVKRFVNTYRLLKARAFDSEAFDVRHDDLGDHEVVAFLLALVTGQPDFAARLIDHISRAQDNDTLKDTVAGVEVTAANGDESAAKKLVLDWLAERRAFAEGKVSRFTYWASEVGRFSFLPVHIQRGGNKKDDGHTPPETVET
jgi:hypothetical protein